jgi:hypothetical protein
MKDSDFMAKFKNNRRAQYAYLTVILFSIFLLLQQTSWVADDWYGARVSRESVTAPVYSHYVPASITTWRVISLLGMDRTYWSLFVVLSIFLIWLGMRKMTELYIANTWLPFVSLLPICSAFGTYSVLYAAKGESSLPGATLFVWSTYLLHKGVRDRQGYFQIALSILLAFLSFFFWEANLLFPMFSLLSLFYTSGLSTLRDNRVKSFLLTTIFSWATYLALYSASGAGSNEVKSQLMKTFTTTINFVMKMFLPIFGGWPFWGQRNEFMSPFPMASSDQWRVSVGAVVAILLFSCLIAIIGKRFFAYLILFTCLVGVYFLPISRERGGMFGEAIFTDFRYTSDLIGPVMIGLLVTLISVNTSFKREWLADSKNSIVTKSKVKYLLLTTTVIASLGGLTTSIANYEIYRTSYASDTPKFLDQLDKSMTNFKECKGCVLLDSLLPPSFGTIGAPWRTVKNVLVARGMNRSDLMMSGSNAKMISLDGELVEGEITRFRLSTENKGLNECSNGMSVTRELVSPNELWTSKIEISSLRQQKLIVQVNTVAQPVALEAGLNVIWFQSFAGTDTVVINPIMPNEPLNACLLSLVSGALG